MDVRPRSTMLLEIGLVAAIIAYFAGRMIYLALNMGPHFAADEVTHIGTSIYYAKSFFLPKDSPDSYHLGLVTHTPYLYYFLMGKLLNLNITGQTDLLFLRFANISLGLASTIVAYKWISLVTTNRIVRILFMIMLTNTIMFTVVSASVSYDNLTNLLSFLAIYYLFRFLDTRQPESLLLFGTALFAGTITKITFIPLAAALAVILIYRERNRLAGFTAAAREYLSRLDGKKIFLCLLLALFAILSGKLYLGNLYQYQKLVPSCIQVLPYENCIQNRMNARSYITQAYKSGALSIDEALDKAAKIDNPADRKDTETLIRNIEKRRQAGTQLLGLSEYTVWWARIMLQRTYATAGLDKSLAEISSYLVIFLLAAIVFIANLNPSKRGKYAPDCLFVVISYVAVLILYVGYPAYLSSESLGVALHGRYLFPIILPLYGLLVSYLVPRFPVPVQWIIAIYVTGVFIYGDLPYFLYRLNVV